MTENLEFVEELKRTWLKTVDSIPDGIAVIDENFQLVRCNRSFLEQNGTKKFSEQIGRKCYEVFAKRQNPCTGCRLKEEFKSAVVSYEIENKNRTYSVISNHADEKDNRYVLHVYRDITEKIELQAKLIQSEKLASIGTLAGGFAHEINNPLAGIILFTQMVLKEMATTSKHYSDLIEIEKAAQRCKVIVSDLLKFARSQETKVTLVKTKVHDALKDALAFVKMGFREAEWNIHGDLNAADDLILADRNRLVQIFLNLCKNALDAMPQGGDLIIKTENCAGEIKIEISDTGSGIPEEIQKRIFDPFFTTKQPGEGTGLGLSVVSSLVQEMNGRILLKSTVGEGSAFTIVFPNER